MLRLFGDCGLACSSIQRGILVTSVTVEIVVVVVVRVVVMWSRSSVTDTVSVVAGGDTARALRTSTSLSCSSAGAHRV